MAGEIRFPPNVEDTINRIPVPNSFFVTSPKSYLLGNRFELLVDQHEGGQHEAVPIQHEAVQIQLEVGQHEGGQHEAVQIQLEAGQHEAVPIQHEVGQPEEVPIQPEGVQPETVPIQPEGALVENEPVGGQHEAVPIQHEVGQPEEVPIQPEGVQPETVPIQPEGALVENEPAGGNPKEPWTATKVGEMKIVANKSVPSCTSALPLSQETGDISEKANVIDSNLSKDFAEIDVIAPVDILKQILKIPYSKSRVSIVVQRGGQTIVLNPGPGVEEGEKLIQKPKCTENCVDASLRLSGVSQENTTLTWLEAWLDDVMESVPELAFFNHQNGTQVYELPPNEISGDAHAFDDPHVVQKNCLDILRFLQSNCKENPGIYWLHRSDGDDVMQLFVLSTISNNHSLSASVFPQVVRACMKEQFARLEIGHVCQDPAPLLQTRTSAISSQLAVVRNVYQAIESLMSTLQLLSSSEQEVRWLPTLKVDRKCWSLILLLGEAYLSLAEALQEVGQLQEALQMVDLACSIYGSIPHKFKDSVFVSTMHKSFSLLLQLQKFWKLVNNPDPSELQMEAYLHFTELSSVRLFWAKAWLLVGEIHVKNNQLVLSPEGSHLVKIEDMSNDIVKILQNKLAEGNEKCGLCFLVYCTCASKIRKQSRKDTSVRGGIFKYLTMSKKDDIESNMSAALVCYEETQKILSSLPKGCKEVLSLIKRKAWVWNRLGNHHKASQKFKEAINALDIGVDLFKESGYHVAALQGLINVGETIRDLADEEVKKMEGVVERSAQTRALKAATREFVKSLTYYKAAKTELSLAIEEGSSVPEKVKVEVYKRFGDTYLKLGVLLSKEDATADAAQSLGLKSISHDLCPGRLSAIDAITEALVLYKSLGEDGKKEVAYTCHVLAQYHKKLCLKSLENNVVKANEHALLADENWENSMIVFGPENEPHIFLKILTERSVLCFSLLGQSNSLSALESNLSRFLEARHISKTVEEKLAKVLTDNFWSQLQKILLEMLKEEKSTGKANRCGKLRDMYLKSLQSTSLSQLDAMHVLWTSEP